MEQPNEQHSLFATMEPNGVEIYEATNEWIWLLYIAVIALSGILGEVVAKYFSNPLNKYFRQKFSRK